MPDAEATYNLAVSKGGTPPAGRTLENLLGWCTARGGNPGRSADAVYAFINAYSAGYVEYTSPGSYTFTIPAHASITVDVRGGGGGGGGMSGDGGNGGNSQFSSAVGGGGGGGPRAGVGGTGASGGASGGDSNITGGGNPGGVGAWDQTFDKYGSYDVLGGDGGPGGRAVKTWAAGVFGVGGQITVVVGGGGGPGGGVGSVRGAAAGSGGYVSISWS